MNAMIKKEKSAWSKFRQREEARTKTPSSNPVSSPQPGPGSILSDANPSLSAESFDQLLQDADQLIEQINQLFNMYAQGVERLPPNAQVSRLDTLERKLSQAQRLSSSDKFKLSQFKSKLTLFREKWDKIKKQKERA